MKAGKSVKGGLARGAATLLSLQMFELGTGLVSQTLIAAYFGASSQTDAYLVAITIVGLLNLWATIPLRQVLIPIFRHDLEREGEEGAWRTASVLLNNLIIVFAFAIAVGWIVAPFLVQGIGAGFDDETSELATSLTRITLFAVLFYGAATFLAQLLLTYQRYFLAGIAGSVDHVVFAATLLVTGTTWGITGLAVAFVAGKFVHVLVQTPVLIQKFRFYTRRIDFRHPRMRELSSSSFPAFISTGGIEIERITDRIFASLLAAGSLSALSFASLIAHVPETFLFHPFQRTLFPHFTKLIASGRTAEFSQQLFQYVRFILFLSVPAAVGIFLLSELLVRTVFERGAFGEEAVRLTSIALAFYAIGLPASFLGKALNNTFLSYKNTRVPMNASLIRIGAKIVLSLVFIPFFAHAGIALADSIGHYIRAARLYAALPAELKKNQLGPTVRSVAGTVAASGVMGLVVFWIKGASEGEIAMTLQLAGLIACGALIYFAIGLVARHREMIWIGRSLQELRGR